jgi:hypothetical protein
VEALLDFEDDSDFDIEFFLVGTVASDGIVEGPGFGFGSEFESVGGLGAVVDDGFEHAIVRYVEAEVESETEMRKGVAMEVAAVGFELESVLLAMNYYSYDLFPRGLAHPPAPSCELSSTY